MTFHFHPEVIWAWFAPLHPWNQNKGVIWGLFFLLSINIIVGGSSEKSEKLNFFMLKVWLVNWTSCNQVVPPPDIPDSPFKTFSWTDSLTALRLIGEDFMDPLDVILSNSRQGRLISSSSDLALFAAGASPLGVSGGGLIMCRGTLKSTDLLLWTFAVTSFMSPHAAGLLLLLLPQGICTFPLHSPHELHNRVSNLNP